MNKKESITLLLLMTMFVGLFGCRNEEPEIKEKTESNVTTEISELREDSNIEEETESKVTTTETSETTLEEPEKETFTQSFEYEVTDRDRRGIKSLEVGLTAEDEYKFSAINDRWSYHVPGIVGLAIWISLLPVEGSTIYVSPEDYSFPEKITLTFNYDEDELMGVPEDNLLLLYCIDDAFDCSIVEGAVLDTENNTVTADITKTVGIYMLVDAYQWYQSQGIDASEYAYELPDDIKNLSAWEKELNTGSIMELIDYDFIAEERTQYHVSTPEQLAAFVYYVNTHEPDTTFNLPLYVVLYLDSDIDLTGYEWMPIGWMSEETSDVYDFGGIIDGQGHTIKGLKISGRRNCGFVGLSIGIVMKDISFIDADITGVDNLGICIGQTTTDRTWVNVYASGNINFKNPDADVGGLAGYTTELKFENCSADFTVNGGDEVLHYLTKNK